MPDRTPEVIGTERCLLLPLRVADAAEMVAVLADPSLYSFIGGTPPTLEDLQRRYAAMVVGHSPDRTQTWLNWIVQLRNSDQRAIGTVQATLTDGDRSAEVAWVIGTAHQGRGYGSEAARALVEALTGSGVTRVVAHVHPEHAASAAVARACGLRPTGQLHEGNTGGSGYRSLGRGRFSHPRAVDAGYRWVPSGKPFNDTRPALADARF